MSDLPALIIAYSRPEGVRSLLESLSRSGCPRVYISVDGPRNVRDAENQSQIALCVREFKDSLEVVHLQRERNLGVGAGVISAIDWFFSKESRGIILEDDLVISEQFLKFAESALEDFSNDDEVWMISGTQVFMDYQRTESVCWANYPMIWGWASWASKWVQMRRVLIESKPIRISKLLSPRYNFWRVGGNRALRGLVDTWDIPLAFEFQQHMKLCVIPPVNLVSNTGNDEFAAHTSQSTWPMNIPLGILPENLNYCIDQRLSMASIYNHKLERSIFRVKFRHAFLSLVAPIIDFRKQHRLNAKLNLKDRLL